jgi:hypothetical protein
VKKICRYIWTLRTDRTLGTVIQKGGGRLERREANPTVDILDRLAKVLSVLIVEFFAVPVRGRHPPQTLRRQLGFFVCSAVVSVASVWMAQGHSESLSR